MKHWVGIDVGKMGAFAVIDEDNNLTYFPTPLIGKEVDTHKISDWLLSFKEKEIQSHFVMEALHSIFGAGAASNFTFGRVNGIIEGVLISHQMSFTKINAKKWQTAMFEGVSPIYKPNTKKKLDTKAMALVAAKRLFPKESFLATSRSSVPHNGIVDSVLMALYCKKHF